MQDSQYAHSNLDVGWLCQCTCTYMQRTKSERGRKTAKGVGSQMSSNGRNFREGKSTSGRVQKYIHVVYESTPELRTSTVL